MNRKGNLKADLSREEIPERPGIMARRTALEVFAGALEGGLDAHEEIRERARQFNLSKRDIDLIYQLTSGCIRRKATLDAIINAFLDKPVDTNPLKPELRNLLRLGIYQLIFCEGIPGRAAVNETVELAKEMGRERLSGMINGILRTILRETIFRDDDSLVPARNVVFIRLGRSAEFKRDILPDAEYDIADYLAGQYSYPAWLVRRWLDRFGQRCVMKLLVAGNEKPAIYLRPFMPKTDVKGLIELLVGEGVEASPSSSGLTVALSGDFNVGGLKALKRGYCLVQDDTAASVVPFLAPKTEGRSLDLCAAPGGKACQLAEMVGGQGQVIAVDIESKRLRALWENIKRLGLKNIEVVEADGRNLPDLGGLFDDVLVDAPCSNSAVLRRRIEARWRMDERSIRKLSLIQRELALSAARKLKIGGVMVYSTCTLEPEENRGVVDWLTSMQGESDVPVMRLEEDRLILPAPAGPDGGYMARLIRTG